MLEALFDRAKSAHRAAFIPYVMAGDPDLSTTRALLQTLSHAGADIIELGIPYGDPLADGPTIAAAAQRALENGVNIKAVFELLHDHKNGGGAPVVLFTYFNPVFKYGIERFAREAGEAGASGVIVPDIAFEEGVEVARVFAQEGIDMPLLIAPSTSTERARKIAEHSSGFIYVVSRLGVTGAGSGPGDLRSQLMQLRAVTHLPLAVGFGVSAPEHVRDVAQLADGFIVGSAIIDAYRGAVGDEAARRIERFVAPLISAANYATAF